MRSLPIGVFDSGVGGLTVVAALEQQLPQESFVYLGDTARLPYGIKSPATVARYTQKNVSFLLTRGVKAVVVACNTASALGLPSFEASVPLWGVIEPGAAAAAAITAGRVGIIATGSTVRSNAYAEAIHRQRAELEVISQACPLFVPLVEEGWQDDPITEQVASRYLQPLLAARIDTLVLGCTHYPLLSPMLGRLAGDTVRLVDSAAVVARQVADDLIARNLLADQHSLMANHAAAETHLCVTDASENFKHIAEIILQRPVSLEWVEV